MKSVLTLKHSSRERERVLERERERLGSKFEERISIETCGCFDL